jgi:Tfp pilus assembly protein PilN
MAFCLISRFNGTHPFGSFLSSGTWLDVDLLRQRRERFGDQRPEILPVRTLLLRGAAIGAALPLLLVLTCVWLWFQEQRLALKAIDLQPLAAEHDLLQIRISKETIILQGLVQTNKSLARSMADVRSSSALFGELRRLMPIATHLDQAQMDGNQLELRGVAAQPNGLRSVNALMLSLAQSGLFQSDGVALKRAQLQAASGNQAAAARTGQVTFNLSAEFAPDAVKAIRPHLLSLGADGLDQRLKRLEQEKDLLE